MPYVSCRYAPPDTTGFRPETKEGVDAYVICTDENGVEWWLAEDSTVGDWLRFKSGGGVVEPADAQPATKPAPESAPGPAPTPTSVPRAQPDMVYDLPAEEKPAEEKPAEKKPVAKTPAKKKPAVRKPAKRKPAKRK